jgi:hypothetical protein
MYDANDRIRWLLNAWIRDVLDANVPRAVKDRRAHERRG